MVVGLRTAAAIASSSASKHARRAAHRISTLDHTRERSTVRERSVRCCVAEFMFKYAGSTFSFDVSSLISSSTSAGSGRLFAYLRQRGGHVRTQGAYRQLCDSGMHVTCKSCCVHCAIGTGADGTRMG